MLQKGLSKDPAQFLKVKQYWYTPDSESVIKNRRKERKEMVACQWRQLSFDKAVIVRVKPNSATPL